MSTGPCGEHGTLATQILPKPCRQASSLIGTGKPEATFVRLPQYLGSSSHEEVMECFENVNVTSEPVRWRPCFAVLAGSASKFSCVGCFCGGSNTGGTVGAAQLIDVKVKHLGHLLGSHVLELEQHWGSSAPDSQVSKVGQFCCIGLIVIMFSSIPLSRSKMGIFV